MFRSLERSKSRTFHREISRPPWKDPAFWAGISCAPPDRAENLRSGSRMLSISVSGEASYGTRICRSTDCRGCTLFPRICSCILRRSWDDRICNEFPSILRLAPQQAQELFSCNYLLSPVLFSVNMTNEDTDKPRANPAKRELRIAQAYWVELTSICPP